MYILFDIPSRSDLDHFRKIRVFYLRLGVRKLYMNQSQLNEHIFIEGLKKLLLVLPLIILTVYQIICESKENNMYQGIIF